MALLHRAGVPPLALLALLAALRGALGERRQGAWEELEDGEEPEGGYVLLGDRPPLALFNATALLERREAKSLESRWQALLERTVPTSSQPEVEATPGLVRQSSIALVRQSSIEVDLMDELDSVVEKVAEASQKACERGTGGEATLGYLPGAGQDLEYFEPGTCGSGALVDGGGAEDPDPDLGEAPEIDDDPATMMQGISLGLVRAAEWEAQAGRAVAEHGLVREEVKKLEGAWLAEAPVDRPNKERIYDAEDLEDFRSRLEAVKTTDMSDFEEIIKVNANVVKSNSKFVTTAWQRWLVDHTWRPTATLVAGLRKRSEIVAQTLDQMGKQMDQIKETVVLARTLLSEGLRFCSFVDVDDFSAAITDTAEQILQFQPFGKWSIAGKIVKKLKASKDFKQIVGESVQALFKEAALDGHEDDEAVIGPATVRYMELYSQGQASTDLTTVFVDEVIKTVHEELLDELRAALVGELAQTVRARLAAREGRLNADDDSKTLTQMLQQLRKHYEFGLFQEAPETRRLKDQRNSIVSRYLEGLEPFTISCVDEDGKCAQVAVGQCQVGCNQQIGQPSQTFPCWQFVACNLQAAGVGGSAEGQPQSERRLESEQRARPGRPRRGELPSPAYAAYADTVRLQREEHVRLDGVVRSAYGRRELQEKLVQASTTSRGFRMIAKAIKVAIPRAGDATEFKVTLAVPIMSTGFFVTVGMEGKAVRGRRGLTKEDGPEYVEIWTQCHLGGKVDLLVAKAEAKLTFRARAGSYGPGDKGVDRTMMTIWYLLYNRFKALGNRWNFRKWLSRDPKLRLANWWAGSYGSPLERKSLKAEAKAASYEEIVFLNEADEAWGEVEVDNEAMAEAGIVVASVGVGGGRGSLMTYDRNKLLYHLGDMFARPVMNMTETRARRREWTGDVDQTTSYHFDFTTTLALLAFKGVYWSHSAQSAIWKMKVSASLTLPGVAGAIETMIGKMLRSVMTFMEFARMLYTKLTLWRQKKEPSGTDIEEAAVQAAEGISLTDTPFADLESIEEHDRPSARPPGAPHAVTGGLAVADTAYALIESQLRGALLEGSATPDGVPPPAPGTGLAYSLYLEGLKGWSADELGRPVRNPPLTLFRMEVQHTMGAKVKLGVLSAEVTSTHPLFHIGVQRHAKNWSRWCLVGGALGSRGGLDCLGVGGASWRRAARSSRPRGRERATESAKGRERLDRAALDVGQAVSGSV